MSVDHRPLYGRRIDGSLDHLRLRDRPTVGRDSIGSVSAIYRLTVGQVSVDASADTRSDDTKRNEDFACKGKV